VEDARDMREPGGRSNLLRSDKILNVHELKEVKKIAVNSLGVLNKKN